jgi:hypothetical protein
LSPRNPLKHWQERKIDRRMDAQIARVETFLEDLPSQQKHKAPVLFFNASTRIHRVSLNAAYSLLTSWALRARGVPVRYLVCQQGMVQCILGTRSGKPAVAPPCRRCLQVSRRLFPDLLIHPITLDNGLATTFQVDLAGATLDDLLEFEYLGSPLGQFVLPGLRWALRTHQLEDDENTRTLYRQYLCSAVSLLHQFDQALMRIQPQAIVVFNGIFYPEAVLRYIASERGIPVITHEVGLQPFSAFFSRKEATFREVEIDKLEELSEAKQAQLDAYLNQRFNGQFSMAGIEFWDGMDGLPEALSAKLEAFEAVIPVFTNVIFDTSQIHANTLFSDMFLWLNQLVEVIDRYPESLFIIRAHPDEDRPGKASAQSVSAWVNKTRVDERTNVIFIGPDKPLSSYELIERSKLVLVYNSSIGLEASILGKPVLCAGRARYTQADTVFFPDDQMTYWAELERMLAEEHIQIPGRLRRNARKFLYHELFHASLDVSAFLALDPTLPGMVTFKDFPPEELLNSASLNAIAEGILEGREFLLAGT